MAEDIHFTNQEIYCRENKVPLFAYKSCNHMYSWVNDESHGKRQTLGEMLLERYGSEDEAFRVSSSTHITSCPGCGRSWCD